MSFTKEQVKILRVAMQKALDEAGIDKTTFTVGNCTFGTGEATFKVSAVLDGAKTRAQEALDDWAALYELDTNKQTQIQGKLMKLVEYNSKARKMPWLVEDINTGAKYKLTQKQVEMWFKA